MRAASSLLSGNIVTGERVEALTDPSQRRASAAELRPSIPDLEPAPSEAARSVPGAVRAASSFLSGNVVTGERVEAPKGSLSRRAFAAELRPSISDLETPFRTPRYSATRARTDLATAPVRRRPRPSDTRNDAEQSNGAMKLSKARLATGNVVLWPPSVARFARHLPRP